jgi:hypothetical protein
MGPWNISGLWAKVAYMLYRCGAECSCVSPLATKIVAISLLCSLYYHVGCLRTTGMDSCYDTQIMVLCKTIS